MLTIGDFARLGQVSVRMLRHYDAIGLLRPAHVDASSNYRYYQARQLARLNRIVALKNLGFTLSQVESLLAEDVNVVELRGMLRLRRAELEAAMADTAAGLAQVELRLRIIESEGTMPTDDIVVKTLPAVRVAELTAVAEDFEPKSIGPAITPLYPALFERLARADIQIVGPGLAYYEDGPQSGSILVHAAMPVGPDATVGASGGADGGTGRDTDGGADGGADGRVGGELRIVELPPVERAATIIHPGRMDNVLATGQQLATWIEASGHRPVGYLRELYLDCPEDMDKWVTELQQPLAAD